MTNPEFHPAGDTTVLRALGISIPGPDIASEVQLPALAIPPGITWLGGGEGRGKTSLLRIFAGAQPCAHSTLQLAGSTLAEAPAAYREQVAWLDPQSTAFEHTTLPDFFSAIATQFPQWDHPLHLELMQALGLQAHLQKQLYMLSTGTKRKVWLSASLASGARLTLLDEPFAALDKASIGCVLDFLAEAADHRTRAWVVADYQAPFGVPLAHTIDLGE